MGFNRGEIRIKAMNISLVDRKGGESILGWSSCEWGHYCYRECPLSLARRVTGVSGDSLHLTMPGTESHTGRSTWHVKKKRWYVQLCTYDKNIIENKEVGREYVIIKGIMFKCCQMCE